MAKNCSFQNSLENVCEFIPCTLTVIFGREFPWWPFLKPQVIICRANLIMEQAVLVTLVLVTFGLKMDWKWLKIGMNYRIYWWKLPSSFDLFIFTFVLEVAPFFSKAQTRPLKHYAISHKLALHSLNVISSDCKELLTRNLSNGVPQ